jgi:hypothetical protein
MGSAMLSQVSKAMHVLQPTVRQRLTGLAAQTPTMMALLTLMPHGPLPMAPTLTLTTRLSGLTPTAMGTETTPPEPTAMHAQPSQAIQQETDWAALTPMVTDTLTQTAHGRLTMVPMPTQPTQHDGETTMAMDLTMASTMIAQRSSEPQFMTVRVAQTKTETGILTQTPVGPRRMVRTPS